MIEALVAETRFNDSTRVICPFCTPTRRKQNLKDMTLTRKDDGAVVYHCHHCYAAGSVQPKETQLSVVPARTIVNNRLTALHYDFLKSRGISQKTADTMRLFSAEKFFSRLSKPTQAVGFPYYRDGALVSAKYRSIEAKDFTQDAGGAHDFFGIDTVIKGEPLIIVEGEIDCLTAIEAGIKNVVSVPSGAPVKVADGKVLPSEDKKFGFVWNAREIIDAAPYVILATDQDPAGQALAEELSRRIGKEKCRLAKFAWKDLNEAWLDDNPTLDDAPVERLNKIIDEAEPYPINGISEANSYLDKINDLYTKGTGKGFTTGYPSIDSVYTIAPGQLTVVTGYPSSGKSNFVDQIMVNLARSSDWKFAICSFENQPEVHITRLMELYSYQSFYEGRDRMSKQVADEAFKWVQEHFLFIDTQGEEPNTIDSILMRAKAAVKRMGVRGLVIDPYNYIDQPAGDKSETNAISDILTKVKKFCMTHDVHTWFVAHPSKINRAGVEQPRPDGMSISGSMAWWAKTDCGITVHRQDRFVEIAVWKCRYRWVGTQGETTLLYNKTAGNYTENLDSFDV